MPTYECKSTKFYRVKIFLNEFQFSSLIKGSVGLVYRRGGGDVGYDETATWSTLGLSTEALMSGCYLMG